VVASSGNDDGGDGDDDNGNDGDDDDKNTNTFLGEVSLILVIPKEFPAASIFSI
jgi:hypothetical protein